MQVSSPYVVEAFCDNEPASPGPAPTGMSIVNGCNADLKLYGAYRLVSDDVEDYSSCDALYAKEDAYNMYLCIEELKSNGSTIIPPGHQAVTTGTVPENANMFFGVADMNDALVELVGRTRVWVNSDLLPCDPTGTDQCYYWFQVSIVCRCHSESGYSFLPLGLVPSDRGVRLASAGHDLFVCPNWWMQVEDDEQYIEIFCTYPDAAPTPAPSKGPESDAPFGTAAPNRRG